MSQGPQGAARRFEYAITFPASSKPASNPVVQRISGHHTLAMVERCAHQSGTHIANAMKNLGDRYRLAKESA